VGDWISFTGALLAIILWCLTNNPLIAVILATLSDILGTYPTVRKSYAKPFTEPLFAWNIAALRSFISFFALETYNLTTAIYPISMFLLNGGVACFLIWRRRCTKPDLTVAK
jgi:hypothetical protein